MLALLSPAHTQERTLNFPTKTVRIATGSAPEQFAERIRQELHRWGKLIREAGIKAK
jgi:tripartite-type tricarboxylate transporter receptor subunit TctC